MKTVAFAFVTLIVGAFARVPFPVDFEDGSLSDAARNERVVTGQIVQAIEDVSRQIREAGMDPWEIDVDAGYELSVAVLFSANALVESTVFDGLSNIVVQNINFSILQSRLTFNIVLPQLRLVIGNAEANAKVFGRDYSASAGGSLIIRNIRLVGDVRVNVGIISGISVRSLSLNFNISAIESRLNLKIFDRDLSDKVNTYLGTTLPASLTQFEREINQLIESVALRIIEENLP